MISTGQSVFADTIYALSSGSVPAGVALIRLSGRHVRDALTAMTGSVPRPREAALRHIRDTGGEIIDRGLVLFFPAPHSFSGEDCAELQLHGGKAVVAAAMETLGRLEGMRQAEAGEFTRRAFMNGKIDLTAAEALADLVSAETEAQRRLALDNSGGRQLHLYESWRRRLLHARAMIEAELDFSDEGDVPGSVSTAVWEDMARLAHELALHLEGHRSARIVREGFRVVVAGLPNAGKSSLVNALVRKDVAIVTDIPGTTRDVIETVLDLGGYKVILSDTAGLRESDDRIEMMGVDRARGALARADLVLHLIGPAEQDDTLVLPDTVEIRRVASKIDLQPELDDGRMFDHAVSVVSGKGLQSLLNDIRLTAAAMGASGGNVLPTQLRHVQLVEMGRRHLVDAVGNGGGDELRAEELRLAERALGRIIGASDVEDVLGEIFSTFCIGK